MTKKMQAHVRTVLLAPVTAATSARSAAFDTRGGKYAAIEILLGASVNTNSTNLTVQLAESDNSTTGFVTFNSSFNATQNPTTNGNVGILFVDLKARRRYLRLTLSPDTTTNGTLITGAIGILDPEFKNPANSSNAGFVVVG
jgi:hypothetical protein